MAPRTLACRIGAGFSTSASAGAAAAEAARAARGGALEGAEIDLAFVFVSPTHLGDAETVAGTVLEELEPRHLLGCVADGVVGRARELEEGPAVAVWAGALPDAEIECFHASAVPIEDGVAVVGVPELDEPELVALLVDPFTFPVSPVLAR
jgi:small ligand-binding sensory domain FIST